MRKTRFITINVQQKKGTHSKIFRKCVGSGRAALGLREVYQRHLSKAHQDCGFEFVRFHGLLSDEMAIYREDPQGNPIYNWQYLDMLMDSIVELGMKPFIELSFMPSALASGKKTLFWWRANVTPPKSYPRWAELVQKLTTHLVQRYGLGEVSKWYFEVWNEPNLENFFCGSMQEYFKLYENAARAIKGVSQQLKAGGPATAENGWLSEFIEFCSAHAVPVDFISTHAYGVKGCLDESGQNNLYLEQDPNTIVKQVKGAAEIIRTSRLPGLELHYTEWNSSYSPLDPIHDTYYQAPYILSTIKDTEGLAGSMSYWTFSDLFEEAGPPHLPFHGGFGLINLQNLKKPSFFAYRFLNMLGPDEVACDDQAALACCKNDSVQLLFWDLSPVNQTTHNKVFFRKELKPASIGTAKVRVEGLSSGKYRVAVYRVGYKCNDVFTSYLGLGCPASLSKDQVAALREASTGQPVEIYSTEITAGQALEKELQMSEWDVVFLSLEKEQ